MVALIVAFVCVACSKDKETPVQEANNNSENEPNTEVVERKPIATMDTKTGKMTYFISDESIQAELNHSYISKDGSERYILESWFIVDEDDSGLPLTLGFVLLDTETENSNTIWLSNGFICKETTPENTNYFISDLIRSGSYSFDSASSEGNYNVTVENGNVDVKKTDDPLLFQPGISIKLRVTQCEGHNCQAGTCFPLADFQGCTPCHIMDDQHYCTSRTVEFTIVLTLLLPF